MSRTVILPSRPFVTQMLNLIVIAPLLVSVVVCAYRWDLTPRERPAGVLNKVLMCLGPIDTPVSLLFTMPQSSSARCTCFSR